MKELDEIKGIDIYLLDQFMKGRVNKESQILDAGCGKGRNINWLLANDYNVSAFDMEDAAISEVINKFPALNFKKGTIESEPFKNQKFDFIICNAVLHFARDHEHFNQMFSALIASLNEFGILFVRMTSNIGLEAHIQLDVNGRCELPDLSNRYVITRNQIEDLRLTYSLKLIEPVKSLKVEDLRTMSTIVFRKI